jgi:membrane-associated HD superfamily phosphohydrolase
MPLGAILKEILGGGNLIETVKDTVDEFVYSKEEKAEDANKAQERAEDLELKRRELDQEQFNKVLDTHLALYGLDTQDRNSARETEIKVLNTPNVSWINSNIRPLLALAVLVISFVFLFMLVFRRSAISAIDSVLLGTVLGGVLGYITVILTYYFGSSSSSGEKDKTIQELTKR